MIFPAKKTPTRSTPSSPLIASKIDFFYKMAFVALSKNSRLIQTSNSKARFEPVLDIKYTCALSKFTILLP